MSTGHYLFGFTGRLNRAKIWLWLLFYIILWVVASIVAGIAMAAMNDPTTGVVGMFALFAIIGIASFISYLAVMVKRLHDRNKSAWWLVVFLLLPGVLVGIAMGSVIMDVVASGGNITEMPQMSPVGMILYLIGLAIGLWFFVELFCLRGTVGPNQYGPDPLGGA
jgi:uncharacterized membrane protein YhaH (DUF805 family)